MKQFDIHVIGLQRGGLVEEGRTENIFEQITAETSKFDENQGQMQEAQWTPSTINTKKNTPRHITVKFLKISDQEKLDRNKRHITLYTEK